MSYYLIPIVDSDILCDGENLKEICRRTFPTLSKREDQRVNIIYSTRIFMPFPESELKEHNKETKLMYCKENVPMYLIAYGDNGVEAHEIVTGKHLSAKYQAALGIRKVTKDSAERYFNESDYFDKVVNYFEHLYNGNLSNTELDQELFSGIYNGVAYLNGKFNGKPINGKFTGTLKLVKKIR